jgi:DNA-directed RNA polymerase subunit M/transcription elongation factor TFIIS
MSARTIFLDLLQKHIPNEEDCKIIEQSVYDYTIHQAKIKGILENIENRFFKRIYMNKCYTLLLNMDSSSYVHNEKFLQSILNHEFDLSQIATLSPQEIHKDHWKKYIDKQSATDEFIYNRHVGVRTDTYTCSKCKKNDCSYYQLQVRCNDEPMTTFVNCLNCGNRWSY